MKKHDLYSLLLAVFCGSLLISNVLASKIIAVGSFSLPGGVLVFPIVYIINDMLAEVYGFSLAKRAIITGFCINLFAVLFYKVSLVLPAPEYIDCAAYEAVLGSTWRILAGSFAAYLAGSLLNSYVMVRMKRHSSLFVRCVASTLLGESVDGIVFTIIAFIGTIPASVIVTMIVSQTLFKTIYEIAVFPATKYIIRKVEAIE